MTQDSTHAAYPLRDSPVHKGARDGFQDQKVLLLRLSKELDEYFSMRSRGRLM